MKIPVLLGFDQGNVIGALEINDDQGEIPTNVCFALAYMEAEGKRAVTAVGMTSDKSYLGFLLNEVELTTEEAAHVIEKLAEKIKVAERKEREANT